MRRVLVIGLGVSGRSAARLMLARGCAVVGVDGSQKVLEKDPEIQHLKAQGLVVYHESAALTLDLFDFAIISPGISPTHSIYRQCLERKMLLVGEAELAFREVKQPCVGITGTNGKTTVTLLTEHILQGAGVHAKALGNVGEPLATYLTLPAQQEVIVAEISSYQLETMETPVFDVGVILNITPDHLDRHLTMHAYAAAKCRLQQCMKPEAPLYVYEQVLRAFKGLLTKGRIISYGRSSDSTYWTDKKALWQGEKIETILPLQYKNLGMHESENALAAWLLCKQFGVSHEAFVRGLETFKKPAHRIEHVLSLDGVDYVDDSKGTNIDAVIQAVGTIQGSIVLIAGGVDKGASYAPWKEIFQKKVRKVIAIGQAAQKIYNELNTSLDVEIAPSLEQAVEQAATCAQKGDTVLLSPGCSSYDMFRDYAHRGEEFKRYVHHLQERREL